MYQVILFIHVMVAAFIILLVLIQQGKGATMGAAFGSGASQTVFGSRGSGSFLYRVTMGCIAVFFVTSISLNYIAKQAYSQEKVITLPAEPVKQVSEPVPPVPAPAVTAPVSGQPASAADQIPVKQQ